MYLYLYFHFGPAAVGGCDSPYFLETNEVIQQEVDAGDCSNRDELSKRNDKELQENTQAKKGRKLLMNTVDEMEECGPTSSFGEEYSKQLDLEEVCVETNARESSVRTRSISSSEWWRVSLLKPPRQRKRECTRQIWWI
jgi:hypothetical protein